VSILGMAVATAAAVVFLALFALELAGYLTNPYIGLLVFVTVPVIFLAGLLLIPIGAWWTARRRRQGHAEPEWPVIDLRVPRQRGILAGVVGLTIVNIAIVSMGAYGGVHYMESEAFCGLVCHVMEPQAVAHKAWPHANVACAQCHVGPGAGAYVEGKLAGTRQLFHVITGNVPTPVPPPDRLIQPAATTCAQCHSPAARVGDELRVIRDYASDETSTESATTLRLHVGDRFSGIHRHLTLDIEYVAPEDPTATIPVVRLRTSRGVREYLAEGASADAPGTARAMECIDCHNRPAHSFSPTPERAIDAAIARGAIPRDLPFARREALAAVTTAYATKDAAMDGIAGALNGFYAERRGAGDALVRRAISGAQEAWARNVFPAMKVTWGTYPNQIGHVDTQGCFRCHDDRKAADGAVIQQECELCHTLPE
jgi:nitrate/TMAO reductase-like tetraheme cytochrome c subunit